MAILISFLLVIVLYGQLAFNAMIYFFQVLNPSWPIWALLYAGCVFIAIRNIKKINIYSFDLVFLIFLSYVAMSFVLIGESSTNEFVLRTLMFIVGPYLCGRILGQFSQLSMQRTLQVIFLIYVVLIITELIKNPALLTEEDRLRLFPLNGGTADKGISTAYNIGLNFGSMWVCFFSSILWFIQKKSFSLKIHYLQLGGLLIIPFLNLAVGSRSSMISIPLTAGVLMLFTHATLKNILSFSLIASVVLTFSYLLMPESRLSLLNQTEYFADIASSNTDSEKCVLTGNSITARGTLAKEAFRLFYKEPTIGVGASNYGLKYCGNKDEFASPHSLFLQVLVDLGFFGMSFFVLLIYLIISNFKNAMKSLSENRQLNLFILFSLWVFTIIQMQFSGNMYYDYQFFLLTGLIAGATKQRHA